jgi:hypothetical protein
MAHRATGAAAGAGNGAGTILGADTAARYRGSAA